MQKECPARLDGARVLCWTPLDDRHCTTGVTRHRRRGKAQDGFTGLAIAAYEEEGGFYLFYCSGFWRVQNDTLHATLAEALAAAEREFAGTTDTWIMKSTKPSGDRSK